METKIRSKFQTMTMITGFSSFIRRLIVSFTFEIHFVRQMPRLKSRMIKNHRFKRNNVRKHIENNFLTSSRMFSPHFRWKKDFFWRKKKIFLYFNVNQSVHTIRIFIENLKDFFVCFLRLKQHHEDPKSVEKKRFQNGIIRILKAKDFWKSTGVLKHIRIRILHRLSSIPKT